MRAEKLEGTICKAKENYSENNFKSRQKSDEECSIAKENLYQNLEREVKEIDENKNTF